MKRAWVLALLGIFTAQCAWADVYSRSTGMNGMGTHENWVSGKKKRDETVVNMGGALTGRQIEITRVDKGVIWSIDPDIQAYTERPIYIPDEPGDQVPDGFKASPNEKWVDLPKEEKDFCSPQLITLPQKQVLAGYESTGYQAVCPGERPQMTMWLAPVKGALEQYDKENKHFDKAFRDEQFKKMTPAERKMTEEVLGAFGNAAGQMLLGLRVDKLPKGVALKMEQDGERPDGTSGKNVLVEILEIRAAAADPALFEIPTGYRKVTDEEMGRLKGEKVAEQMGLGGMYKDIQALQVQAAGPAPQGYETTDASEMPEAPEVSEGPTETMLQEAQEETDEFDARNYDE